MLIRFNDMAPHFASRPLLAVIVFVATILPVNALYFYMDANIPKCFYEELPKDTLVVGSYIARSRPDRKGY